CSPCWLQGSCIYHRAPNGIRTRAAALKGRSPRPLDDGDAVTPPDVRPVEDRLSIGEPETDRQKPGSGQRRAPGRLDTVVEMTPEEFEEAVADGLDAIPPELAAQ